MQSAAAAAVSHVRDHYLVWIAFCTLLATSGEMVGMLWAFFACSAAFAITSSHLSLRAPSCSRALVRSTLVLGVVSCHVVERFYENPR